MQKKIFCWRQIESKRLHAEIFQCQQVVPTCPVGPFYTFIFLHFHKFAKSWYYLPKLSLSCPVKPFHTFIFGIFRALQNLRWSCWHFFYFVRPTLPASYNPWNNLASHLQPTLSDLFIPCNVIALQKLNNLAQLSPTSHSETNLWIANISTKCTHLKKKNVLLFSVWHRLRCCCIKG